MKALFLVPSPASKGGVSNYYSVIQKQIHFPYEYFIRGVRHQSSKISRMLAIFYFIDDFFRFFLKLLSGNYSIVIINTSFGLSGFWRDYIFIKISQWLGAKYLVFFRGIDNSVLEVIQLKFFKFFNNSFLRASAIIVLSKELEKTLRNFNYRKQIFLETTVVDSGILAKISKESIIKVQRNARIKMLFLSRIERSKGIYELIEAFKLLSHECSIELHICGDGSEFKNVKNLTSNFDNIFLKGYVEGQQKNEEFASSQIFILPSYKEGMPNSVIEAMSFGLPIITTAVGGIPDFFSNNNGILLDKISDTEIMRALKVLINDEQLRINIGLFNFNYAKERFYAEKVVERLSNIIHNSDL